MTKRTTHDFDIPGKVRFSEHNPRGKKADWIEFACIKGETDDIMQAIGMKMGDHRSRSLPAGTLLAEICREWMERKAQP